MSQDFHERVREIFLEACELSPTERVTHLDEVCRDDPKLRSEVESLLDHHQEGDPTESTPPTRDTAEVRFRPGQLFAGRYRILTLLGRGGMGEVYRVHDELLDEPVALKILLGAQPSAVQSLLQEVRLARSITHSSIVRVFDVSEADGEPFFTMELVEGEDLSTLLRRAGRLAPDRVVDLAHQLLSGLAAAHGKGIIHRDLKPGNILIDPEGRARITDFGIAVTGSTAASAPVVGTPGYMAPEQWAGAVADEKSDLYSLALLLHESLTGQAVFQADGLADWVQQQRTSRPPELTSIPGIDREFAKVVGQTLERDPTLRPASALAMAAALPGCDPLAIALEVGVTPPLDVVAAARPQLGWSTRKSVLLVLTLVLSLAALLGLQEELQPSQAHEEVEDPAILEHRAQGLLSDLGYESKEGESNFGFVSDRESQSSRLHFWYVQHGDRWVAPIARSLLQEPQLGRLIAVLDAQGRLVYFTADPSNPESSLPPLEGGEHNPLDLLLKAAGLDRGMIEPSEEPLLLPLVSDRQNAWRARRSEEEESLDIHLAWSRDRPVYFAVTPTLKEAEQEESEGFETALALAVLVIFAVLLAILPVAWRNLRQGLGDSRGARRLFFVIAGLISLSALLGLGYRQNPFETGAMFLRDQISRLVFHGFWVWFAYLGLEPLVRRWWPEALVAWNRWLAGSWRDPLVGRSLIVGTLAGTFLVLNEGLSTLVQLNLSSSPFVPLIAAKFNAALGVRTILSAIASIIPLAIYNGFVILLTLVLLQWMVRKRWLATLIFLILTIILIGLTGGGSLAAWISGIGFSLVAMVLLTRFGLATFCWAFGVMLLLGAFPLSQDGSAWFAGAGYVAMGTVLALGIVGAWLVRDPGYGSAERDPRSR